MDFDWSYVGNVCAGGWGYMLSARVMVMEEIGRYYICVIL